MKSKFLLTKLQRLAKERQIFAWRAENLITRAELVAYGKSPFITEVKKDLDELVKGEKEVDEFSVDQCCWIRDYLIMMLCVANALRASNILKFSVLVIDKLMIFF